MSATRTHVNYFDPEVVDEVVGGAFKTLETDFERRRPHISRKAALAMERRLDVLRAAWALLLEPLPAEYEQ